MPLLLTIAATIGWAFLGILLLYAGVRLYDWLDPIDYQAEIKKGNVAAGLIVATLIASLAAIVIAVLVS